MHWPPFTCFLDQIHVGSVYLKYYENKMRWQSVRFDVSLVQSKDGVLHLEPLGSGGNKDGVLHQLEPVSGRFYQLRCRALYAMSARNFLQELACGTLVNGIFDQWDKDFLSGQRDQMNGAC